VPVLQGVDKSMPFSAPKMAGLLKKSFKKRLPAPSNQAQNHRKMLSEVWKEEIFKHMTAIGVSNLSLELTFVVKNQKTVLQNVRVKKNV